MKISEKFINELLYKQENLHEDECLDFIFGSLDDMCYNGCFEDCNEILSSIKITELTINNIVGILTITANYSDKLKERKLFYNSAFSHITNLKSDCVGKILKNIN